MLWHCFRHLQLDLVVFQASRLGQQSGAADLVFLVFSCFKKI
jgi:hypothetical protein